MNQAFLSPILLLFFIFYLQLGSAFPDNQEPPKPPIVSRSHPIVLTTDLTRDGRNREGC